MLFVWVKVNVNLYTYNLKSIYSFKFNKYTHILIICFLVLLECAFPEPSNVWIQLAKLNWTGSLWQLKLHQKGSWGLIYALPRRSRSYHAPSIQLIASPSSAAWVFVTTISRINRVLSRTALTLPSTEGLPAKWYFTGKVHESIVPPDRRRLEHTEKNDPSKRYQDNGGECVNYLVKFRYVWRWLSYLYIFCSKV